MHASTHAVCVCLCVCVRYHDPRLSIMDYTDNVVELQPLLVFIATFPEENHVQMACRRSTPTASALSYAMCCPVYCSNTLDSSAYLSELGNGRADCFWINCADKRQRCTNRKKSTCARSNTHIFFVFLFSVRHPPILVALFLFYFF